MASATQDNLRRDLYEYVRDHPLDSHKLLLMKRKELVLGVLDERNSAQGWFNLLKFEENGGWAVRRKTQSDTGSVAVRIGDLYEWALRLVEKKGGENYEAEWGLEIGHAREQWFQCPDEARSKFNSLKAGKMVMYAPLYKDWASLEFSSGNCKEAVDILRDAINANVQPISELESLRKQMEEGSFRPHAKFRVRDELLQTPKRQAISKKFNPNTPIAFKLDMQKSAASRLGTPTGLRFGVAAEGQHWEAKGKLPERTFLANSKECQTRYPFPESATKTGASLAMTRGTTHRNEATVSAWANSSVGLKSRQLSQPTANTARTGKGLGVPPLQTTTTRFGPARRIVVDAGSSSSCSTSSSSSSESGDRKRKAENDPRVDDAEVTSKRMANQTQSPQKKGLSTADTVFKMQPGTASLQLPPRPVKMTLSTIAETRDSFPKPESRKGSLETSTSGKRTSGKESRKTSGVFGKSQGKENNARDAIDFSKESTVDRELHSKMPTMSDAQKSTSMGKPQRQHPPPTFQDTVKTRPSGHELPNAEKRSMAHAKLVSGDRNAGSDAINDERDVANGKGRGELSRGGGEKQAEDFQQRQEVDASKAPGDNMADAKEPKAGREESAVRRDGHRQKSKAPSDSGRKAVCKSKDHIVHNGFPAETTESVMVRGHVYEKLKIRGEGGSSKVYKVLHKLSKRTLALKRCEFNNLQKEIAHGFKEEISILRQLRGKPRIIQLIDWQIWEEAGVIYMVVEEGEIDLQNLLASHKQLKRKFGGNDKIDWHFIKSRWQEMLEAVHTIHEARIIHSDLKPANFLMVKCELKLIDFGIAKSMPTDTTGVIRDVLIGTVPYMAPETFLYGQGSLNSTGNQPSIHRVGRPSDIWSLGIILYEMVYGYTPFSQVPQKCRMHAITSEKFKVDFPELDNKHCVDVIKQCLIRDPAKRVTMKELMGHPFLQDEKAKRSSDASQNTLPSPHTLKTALSKLVAGQDLQKMSVEDLLGALKEEKGPQRFLTENDDDSKKSKPENVSSLGKVHGKGNQQTGKGDGRPVDADMEKC